MFCKWLCTLTGSKPNSPKSYNLVKDDGLSLTHSQLLEGLKSEFKYKTAKGEKVGAHSLAHNTLRGRRACWSSGMGLERVDKLYSFT
jgi:hypothetical protein